jgi:hypothetical protein
MHSVTALAVALNAVLQRQVTAERCMAPAREDPAALRAVPQLPGGAGDDGVRLFPTTNCPDLCETCGTCRIDCTDCEECADGGCEICLLVTMAPRTAVILAHASAILADEFVPG